MGNPKYLHICTFSEKGSRTIKGQRGKYSKRESISSLFEHLLLETKSSPSKKSIPRTEAYILLPKGTNLSKTGMVGHTFYDIYSENGSIYAERRSGYHGSDVDGSEIFKLLTEGKDLSLLAKQGVSRLRYFVEAGDPFHKSLDAQGIIPRQVKEFTLFNLYETTTEERISHIVKGLRNLLDPGGKYKLNEQIK